MNDTSSANPFSTPEAGSLNSGRFEAPVEVEYSAMKTPELYVKTVTKESVAEARATLKLGFHFWDRTLETPASVAIDKFSFVVLHTFCSVSGFRETQPGQPGIQYYSNYVKNSKFEALALWEKGIKRPIAKGFYKGKKGDNDFAKLTKYPATDENELLNAQPGNFVKVPDGASWHQNLFVWWIEGNRMLNLKLTTMVSREIKNAISRAEARGGRRLKPDNVTLFSLADGALWGFTVTKFRRVQKDGTDYANSGEMFLVPEFECGTVKATGEGANPELHATCIALQSQIASDYEQEVERRKKFGVDDDEKTNESSTSPDAVTAPPMPVDDANFPTQQTGGGNVTYQGDPLGAVDMSKTSNTGNSDAPPATGKPDDLPF